MHKFNEEDTFQRRVAYKYGLQFNSRVGFYHLWDSSVAHSVATIRLTDDKAIVRYVPEWMFLEQLLKFRLDEGETVFVPSNNVCNHDGFIHDRIQNRCERAVQMYNRSSEPQSYTFVMSNPFTTDVIQTTVSYSSPSERRNREDDTRQMLAYVIEARIYNIFPSEMQFSHLENLYLELNNQRSRPETQTEVMQRRLLERLQADQLRPMTAQPRSAWTAGNTVQMYSQEYGSRVDNVTREQVQNIFSDYRREDYV